MSFPFDAERLLATAPVEVRLRIVGITFDAARARCAEQGIRAGDVLTCREASPHHVLVELEGRGARWLASSLAVCVEVERAATDERYVSVPGGARTAAGHAA